MIVLSVQHHASWWVAACCGLVTSVIVLYAVALVGLSVIGQWTSGRALVPAEPLTATGGAPDGCVLEDGDVLADTVYVPVLVLSCWDAAWNLQVVSPGSARPSPHAGD
jgi:hypothetical protein